MQRMIDGALNNPLMGSRMMASPASRSASGVARGTKCAALKTLLVSLTKPSLWMRPLALVARIVW